MYKKKILLLCVVTILLVGLTVGYANSDEGPYTSDDLVIHVYHTEIEFERPSGKWSHMITLYSINGIMFIVNINGENVQILDPDGYGGGIDESEFFERIK